MLHLGDCLDVMQDIPDGSVDMVCTDPPYGTVRCAWDVVIPFEPMWAHLKRVTKPNGAIVLTASQPFTSALVMSNVAMFKYCWIWEKPKASGFLNARKRPLKAYEDILVFSCGPPNYFPQGLVSVSVNSARKNKAGNGNFGAVSAKPYIQKEGNFPKNVLRFQHETGPVHPTQKPVALMEYMIRTYTNPGETVLDFTAGSGTTGVAAANTGRKFIGIEMDATYFATAQARIQTARAQQITRHMKEAAGL